MRKVLAILTLFVLFSEVQAQTTLDQTPPTVNSINRQSPPGSTTNATSVTFKVTFSEKVSGVDATDFTATVVSGTLSATVASVTAVSSSIYSVTVNSISGDGVLRLDLNASGTGITDLAGNAISGGYTTGQTYTIYITPPTVKSINRQSPPGSTTNATSVTFKVTFSESVNGVDATDFTTTVVSGTLSATVASVTAVSSSIYSVTVNFISGDGVLRLDLNASGTGITDLAGNAISGGYTSGQTYTIDITLPTVKTSNRESMLLLLLLKSLSLNQ